MTDKLSKIKLRQMTKNDIPEIFKWIQKEDWGYDQIDIERILRLYPNSSIIACIDDEIIGGITAYTTGNRCILVHVIVKEKYRSKGVGQMMLSAMIDAESKKGIDIFEAYLLPKVSRFYARNRFREIEQVSFFIVDQVDRSTSNGSEKYIRKLEPSDLQEILDIDRITQGQNREFFIREFVNEFSEFSLGLTEENKLIGYIQGRSSEIENNIGPWIMVKPEHETGQLMLRSLLSRLPNKKSYIIVPSSNELAMTILKNNGFRKDITLIRMVRSNTEVGTFSRDILAIGSIEVG